MQPLAQMQFQWQWWVQLLPALSLRFLKWELTGALKLTVDLLSELVLSVTHAKKNPVSTRTG